MGGCRFQIRPCKFRKKSTNALTRSQNFFILNIKRRCAGFLMPDTASSLFFKQDGQLRSPKMAVPTRTSVEPSAIASG